MKNYYKILGVKETASEEEIRAHWIELMRRLHPDRKRKGAVEDQRVKEINEAYETLKHSSTRVKYDLKRAYDGKKRGSYFKKLGVPACILINVIIIGIIYIKNSQSPPPSELIVSNKIDQINKRNEINQLDSTIQRSKDAIGAINQSKTTTQQPYGAAAQRPEETMTLNVHAEGSTSQRPHGSIGASAEQTQRAQNTIAQSLRVATTLQPNDSKDDQPLIAKEEEIRQFFYQYIERYTQKDIDGFISLFSSKAIQNQKDGLEGIRKIYKDFFNISQELRYRTEGMKIKICQNAVEVKARYEVNQMLKKGEGSKVWRGNIRWVLVKENEPLKILSIDYHHQKTP
jgi:hypothetical protein